MIYFVCYNLSTSKWFNSGKINDFLHCKLGFSIWESTLFSHTGQSSWLNKIYQKQARSYTYPARVQVSLKVVLLDRVFSFSSNKPKFIAVNQQASPLSLHRLNLGKAELSCPLSLDSRSEFQILCSILLAYLSRGISAGLGFLTSNHLYSIA